MSASDFFNRWSKRKTEAAQADLADAPAADAIVNVPATAEHAKKPPPTIADVENLTAESDYSPFLAKDVDESVKRSALKKLFADPHFNVMDGLDTYIDDYSKPDPIPAAMLAALNHAKGLLDPLGATGSQDASVKTLMALVDPEPQEQQQGRQQIASAGHPATNEDASQDAGTIDVAGPPSDTQPTDNAT